MSSDRYLLDTHCLLWFQENNPKISEATVELISNPDEISLFSQISLFEISIKLRVGKLPLFHATVQRVYEGAINYGFTFVPINNNHIFKYHEVPLMENHRDPFDRLLIATALGETAVILSADEKFSLYADMVKVIW